MSRRALLIALFVSFAVNIFAVGALVGAAVIGPHEHGRGEFGPGGQGRGRGPMGPGGGGLAPAAGALAPEHREAWRTALREQAVTAGPKLRDARQMRQQAWRGLAQQPMDAQAVLGQLQQSRALEAEARADIDRRVVEFAGALPGEERARLAQALAEPRRGGRGPSGRRGPPGERQAGLPDR